MPYVCLTVSNSSFVISLKERLANDGKTALLTLAKGDMRRVLNVLQAASLAHDIIDEDSIYTCVGHPLPSDISNIYHWLLNEHFNDAYTSSFF